MLALHVAAGFSPSGLSSEKKLVLPDSSHTEPLAIATSDTHFEVDMGLAAYGSRAAWANIHSAIVSAVVVRARKEAIVICKNAHLGHPDLLRVLFSYMQDRGDGVELRYVFLAEHLTAIPDAVVSRCRVVPVPRPARAMQLRCLGRELCRLRMEQVSVRATAEVITDAASGFDVGRLREAVYLGLTRNMYVGDWITGLGAELDLEDRATETVLRFYESRKEGYRPIYHLEKLATDLAILVHESRGGKEASVPGHPSVHGGHPAEV